MDCPMDLAQRVALVTSVLLTSACSGSVLIRKDDATFARSLRRYERTRRLVDGDPTAETEAPLFLQAEALYRYRFEPPPHSFTG